MISIAKYVTVSAKIDAELRERMVELGISPTEVIRKALRREVEERMREELYKKVERASEILSKVGEGAWVKAVRESRDEG